MRYAAFLLLSATLLSAVDAQAGIYAPAAGQPGSTAVSAVSATIAGWATGYLDYLPGPNVADSFKTPGGALGKANATLDPSNVVVLGDSGSITLTFAGAIFNGAGADFAVFENSFSDTFLELAWVEVSSDGSHFFRFPGFSFTPGAIGSFGTIDPTNLDGLAGKYRAGFGTPFDLDQLSTVPGLDVNAVRFVKIVDIKGDGSVFDNYPAQFGGPNRIYDPDPTQLSGGFDLDAVGVMHLAPVPEPSTLLLSSGGLALLALLARRSRRRTTSSSQPE